MSGCVEIEYRGPFMVLPADVQTDETVCAGCGCRVGPVLTIDPETGHDRGGWVSLWRAPDGRLLCEDCTVEAEAVTR